MQIQAAQGKVYFSSGVWGSHTKSMIMIEFALISVDV